MTTLKNHFIISLPHMNDPLFKKTVIFICEHDKHGAMGLIINKEINKKDVLFSNQENDKGLIQVLNKNNLFIGGPVLTDRILFLHTNKNIDESISINKEVSVSSDIDTLKSMVNTNNQQYKLFLGHSGWSKGQLEREIENGDWLIQKSINSLIFEKKIDHIWGEATKSLGIEINDISSITGQS
ncbi:MAG: YqgE/AlgH family protein [Candidatus Neomarinimicrobiota bacterium]